MTNFMERVRIGLACTPGGPSTVTWYSSTAPGGKSLVLRPGEVVLAKMTNFLLSSVSEASVLSQQ